LKVDKKESETLHHLNRRMSDLENSKSSLIVENERLSKMNRDLSDITRNAEKDMINRQALLEKEL
jgi:hypothetical protein